VGEGSFIVTTTYQHLKIPRREPYYLAIGLALVCVHLARGADTPAALLAVTFLSLFVALMMWRAFRHPPAGMEIAEGEWRIFRGHSQWSVPLREISAVRVMIQRDAPALLALVLKGGRTEFLPPELRPAIGPLAAHLARFGIPVRT
jgi:hypothetical protein